MPEVQQLVDSGTTVCGIDLLYQGDFLAGGPAVTSTRRVKNPREAAAYTFGYNRSLFAQRVHDVLTTLQFIRNHERPSRQVGAVALDPIAGTVLAAALAVAGDGLDFAACDTHGFRFGSVAELQDVRFLPGGAKYGDLPGLLSLGRVQTLWVAGEPEPTAAHIARLSGAKVVRHDGAANPAAVVEWISGNKVPEKK